MKFHEAEAMGPPKVVVAVPVTESEEVVAFVNRPMVDRMRLEKNEFEDVALSVLNWVEDAIEAKNVVEVA